jgi:AraC-like DNA-binding protein
MIEDLRFNRNLWLYFFYVFIVAHLLFYSIKGFYVLKNALIDESVDEKGNFKLIKYISYLISFVLIFSIIIFVFLTLFKNNYDVLFVFSTITLLWFYVVINIFRQQIYRNVFSVENLNLERIKINDCSVGSSEIININTIKDATKNFDCVKYQEQDDSLERDVDYEENKYEKVRLSTDFLNQLDIKVQQVIIKEKAFQDPNFKISDLATKTKVSRYYLAQYFTYMHNMNFREYINSLRIEEILNQIQNRDKEDQISVNELFFQSAFNSKASFFKSFKNVTGMTPTEYMRVI